MIIFRCQASIEDKEYIRRKLEAKREDKQLKIARALVELAENGLAI